MANVQEVLSDFPGTAGAYFARMRRDIACRSYSAPDQQGHVSTMTVSALSPDEIANGIDTGNGAVGLGVHIAAASGARTNIVWILQGDFVIEVRDSRGSATSAASIQLADRALSRMKEALA